MCSLFYLDCSLVRLTYRVCFFFILLVRVTANIYSAFKRLNGDQLGLQNVLIQSVSFQSSNYSSNRSVIFQVLLFSFYLVCHFSVLHFPVLHFNIPVSPLNCYYFVSAFITTSLS